MTLPRALPWLCAFALTAITGLTIPDYGITWDERPYIQSGDAAFTWLRSPSLDTLDRAWQANHEHPPLVKILGGASRALFADAVGVVTAHRLAVLPFVFMLCLLLYLLARRLFESESSALFSVVALASMPRLFFDAHLATLDVPAAALWFATVYAGWIIAERPLARWWCALALGLCSITKLTALAVLFPVIAIWLWQTRAHGWSARTAMQLWPCLVVPPLMTVALWPWMWTDTFARIGEYLLFHVEHYPVPTLYFGVAYTNVPWHYPFVMTVLTLPFVVLVAAAAGIVDLGRRKRVVAALVAGNALFPLLIVAVGPATYDGVRLFLPALPFIALAAGAGCGWAAREISRRVNSTLAGASVGLCIGAAGVHAQLELHPYQHAFYNVVIGGVRGAESAGLETEYWCSPLKELIDELNEIAPVRVGVPFCRWPLLLYQETGQLAQSVEIAPFAEGEVQIVPMRRGAWKPEVRALHDSATPIRVLSIDGAPLVKVYALRPR